VCSPVLMPQPSPTCHRLEPYARLARSARRRFNPLAGAWLALVKRPFTHSIQITVLHGPADDAAWSAGRWQIESKARRLGAQCCRRPFVSGCPTQNL